MRIDVFLSRLGLGAIAFYCLLSSIYYSSFAELHVDIAALPFPFFISEILLLFCFFIFVILLSKDREMLSKSMAILLGSYFLWVVGKTLTGYIGEGALSFRNAALFYYPLTGVITYVFYRRARLSLNVLMAAGSFAGIVILCRGMFIWYWLTFGLIFAMALLNIRRSWLRWLGWGSCLILVVNSLPFLYRGPRAHVLAMVCVALFLFFYYAFLWVKRRDILRLGIATGMVVVFVAGLMIFADHNKLSSVISWDGVRSKFRECAQQIEVRRTSFIQKSLTVHLFHPNETLPVVDRCAWWQWSCKANLGSKIAVRQPLQSEVSRVPVPVNSTPTGKLSQVGEPRVPVPVNSTPERKPSQVGEPRVPVPVKSLQEGFKGMMQLSRDAGQSDRTLDLNQNNIVFRLLVWRDMKDEMIREKAWWGFGFGHPQRSPSLEILNWATSEWSRDGWIAPHNSFFHVIYRAGILGVFFIGIFFFLVVRMVRDFQRLRSSVGGLLVGGLVYWIVAANFSVTLEFPYNAILFWGWFGVTMVYRDQLTGQQGQGEA